MSSEVIEVEVKVEKEIRYFDNSSFGIYGCTTDEYEKVRFNEYGNFTVTGTMPRLNVGKKYQLKIEPRDHPKYGFGYEYREMQFNMPQTKEEQRQFLLMILTENQVNEIYRVHPDEDVVTLFKENKLDYKKIKGLGEKTYPLIRETVLDNLDIQHALGKLGKFGLSYGRIAKLVKFYGSTQLLIQKVEENPYILCEVDGLAFKTVDEYAINMGIEPTSNFRINSCVEFLLKEIESSGHTWCYTDNLTQQCTELLKIDERYIRDSINHATNDKILVIDDRIALRRNYIFEKKISNKINQLLSVEGNFDVINVEGRITAIEEEQGFSFTHEQRQAIDYAIKYNVLVVNGRAGAGKSSLLKGIIKVLDGYTYQTCALSGKASQRITEIGLTSSTLHRLLGYNQTEGFTYNHENPLPYDIIVLDETSMVNIHLFYALINAIEKGKKLIILGDVEQLSAIGAGQVLRDLIDSGAVPCVELTIVHRQALKSGILQLANMVRDGKQITKWGETGLKIVGELKDAYLFSYSNKTEIPDKVLEICNRYKGDIMDFQVITPMKERGEISAAKLNGQLQQIFNPDEKDSLTRSGFTYKVNDKVIKSGNDYTNNIFNGTVGSIEGISSVNEGKLANIEFLGVQDLVRYTLDEMGDVDPAYAFTVHRSQGSQYKHVVFILDFSAYKLLTRQLVYSALTRAEKSLIFVFENKALHYAIKNSDSERQTFLCEMLGNEEKINEVR